LLGDHVEHHDVGRPAGPIVSGNAEDGALVLSARSVSRAVIVCRPFASKDVVTDQVPSAATVVVPIAAVPS
jgi:hypothetical protein